MQLNRGTFPGMFGGTGLPEAMKRPLQIYGSPSLRRKARRVAEVDREVRKLASDMLDTMHLENGIGLAAEQVGADIALCVVDIPPQYDRGPSGRRINPGLRMPLVLINPRIADSSAQTVVAEEGCLSFPGIYVPIRRAAEIKVQYLSLENEPTDILCRGLLARAIQHEVDHLDGILLIDHMPVLRRLLLSPRLLQLKRIASQDGST
ncbi:MAG TPA: peptide deformylase [Kiritimatiellae bacterium]|nr:peptide deformylase [Kiritimatiellia bacterium]